MPCANCSESTFAVIPADSRVVPDEDAADGKVWVDCDSCDDRFLVYYRTVGEPTEDG